MSKVPQGVSRREDAQFSSVQSFSCVLFFATPWTAAHQALLSITNSWSLLKLMSIESVMPSNHLILCHPLLLLPSIFHSIRVFSKESDMTERLNWTELNWTVWMWELSYKESWALKNWCFWTMVLDKTLEGPLDSKENKPVNPKGNQSFHSLEGLMLKL